MPAPNPSNTHLQLVLASGSPWRRALLRDTGVACEARDPGIDEAQIQDPDPVVLARRRALAKARALAQTMPGALIIGADQVAHMDGEIFGKPKDSKDHLARLRAMRGRSHALVSAVALVWGERELLFEETARLRMRGDVSDAELEAYVALGEGAGCAAGYQAEHIGAQLIAEVQGDWFTVIGLPVYRLIDALRALGWRPPALSGGVG